MSLASPVGDVVIDAPELRSNETSLGGNTGDPVELRPLDGLLALGEGSFCALLATKTKRAKVLARERRVAHAVSAHTLLLSKLSEPRFRALYISVARLFATELVEQAALMRKAESLPDGQERKHILSNVSFVGKWAPTSVAVSEEGVHVLRSFYQRWVLTPLRAAAHVPEPIMASRRWGEIPYPRVPSISIANISSSTTASDLMPIWIRGRPKSLGAKSSLAPAIRARISKRETQVAGAQWDAMIARLRSAGMLDNCLAICDVSGSMGNIYWTRSQRIDPILPAVALLMTLSQLAKPPFSNMFITFSADPEIVTLEEGAGLATNAMAMVRSEWGMNTNLNAVFVSLLLLLAVQHGVAREDMVKRLFVFSSMQFDQADQTGQNSGLWC
ncbi:hypothetical protein BGW80DRAFT_1454622 [Lactifluus volemus]|nr:hypothetical protein BGW80DRAFT_1454622 [Lactifluus volemus]